MGFYLPYFRKYRLPFCAAVCCVSLEACCDLLGPTLMANIINKGIETGSSQAVIHWGMLMLAVTAMGACFAVARNILASRVSQRFGADVRSAVFAKILRFSETSLDKIEAGSLITRMTNDTTQVMQFANGIMRIFLKAPLTCIGSIILASLLNFKLSFIIYGLVLLVTVCIGLAMRISYPRFALLQRAVDRVNTTVQEYLLGVRLVKAFGTYDTEEKRFAQANSGVLEAGVSSQMPVTLLAPFMTLLVGVGVIAILYSGSRLFIAGETLPGDISAFIIYMLQILSSLIMMTNIFTVFVRTKASTTRLDEVLGSAEDSVVSGNRTLQTQKISAAEEPVFAGNLAFNGVCFAYPSGSGVRVVTDVSFSVAAGEHLAVIGPTGSGKSTLVWLLLRFYEPTAGCIRLDGTDIQTLAAADVRRAVALVPQKVFLTAGTVEENLRWGNPGSVAKQLDDALAKAQADFIYNLPDGLSSRLESSGVNFSGGQKQRLAVARALVKSAPILILDDATSALDVITEAKLLAGLKNAERRQTLITITQRCGTAMGADRILVMENGSAAGFGKHEELLKSCEVYRQMYQSQITGLHSIAGEER